jgi:hypothetical protein
MAFASNSLDVEDSVSRVHGSLVLCSFSNETLLVCERDKRRRCKAPLLVRDCGGILAKSYSETPASPWNDAAGFDKAQHTDLDICALVVCNARIGGA